MLKRILQSSTFNGLTIFSMLLGLYIGPAEVEAVIMAVGGVYTAFKTLQDNDRF